MKYKVNFDVKKIVRMFRAGKRVSEIARAIGFPAGVGQNRTRAALIKRGLYKSPRKTSK